MVDAWGYAGGFFLMLSYFPQLARSLRTKAMDDLSWGLLIATAVSGVCYEVYALLLGLTPVVIMNGIFTLSVLVTMAFKVKFAKEHAA